jgi:hypothetical protein
MVWETALTGAVAASSNSCHFEAARTDSEKRPTFVVSTCETANITTKKAKSSVMKSAYDTSQRS